MKALLTAVCDFYGARVDDREPAKGHVNLHDVADRFNITVLRAVTLLRFMHSNRRLRRIPGQPILRKASERSWVTESMQLWK